MRFVLNFEQSALYEPSQQQRLAESLTDYFGTQVNIDIEVGRVERETPYAHRLRLRAERQAAAVETLNNDALVRKLVENFNGRLLEESVLPIDEE